MRIITVLSLIVLLAVSFTACIEVENPHNALAPGYWRASLSLNPKLLPTTNIPEKLQEVQDIKREDVKSDILPFNFEVIYDEDGTFYLELINGKERIKITDIDYGRDLKTAKDTVQINFPIYDSYIKGIYQERYFEGKWVVNNRNSKYSIPFTATHGQDHRFTALRKKPKADLTGRWEVTFSPEDDPYPAIGEFVQKGNKITGTFMTETGDYRFLEGTVQDDKMYLSVFDGAHAFLFDAKILEDGSLLGTFRSGKHYETVWTAKRNSEASIGNPNNLTFLKEGYETVDFAFENEAGQMISLKDEKYKGKVKLVQIFGTWCPNCRDETSFLVDYLKENPSENLEVIALAFEKHKDKDRAKQQLKIYKEKMGILYEVLLAGPSSKKEAAKALPMLNHVLSYPTLIFIDKENKVRRIHTGFNGPATDLFMPFEVEFKQFVNSLLKE